MAMELQPDRGSHDAPKPVSSGALPANTLIVSKIPSNTDATANEFAARGRVLVWRRSPTYYAVCQAPAVWRLGADRFSINRAMVDKMLLAAGNATETEFVVYMHMWGALPCLFEVFAPWRVTASQCHPTTPWLRAAAVRTGVAAQLGTGARQRAMYLARRFPDTVNGAWGPGLRGRASPDVMDPSRLNHPGSGAGDWQRGHRLLALS